MEERKNSDEENFCRSVYELCAEKGITIKELAAATKIPLSLLQELERGIIAKRLTAVHLLAICDYFQTTPSKLFKE